MTLNEEVAEKVRQVVFGSELHMSTVQGHQVRTRADGGIELRPTTGEASTSLDEAPIVYRVTVVRIR